VKHAENYKRLSGAQYLADQNPQPRGPKREREAEIVFALAVIALLVATLALSR